MQNGDNDLRNLVGVTGFEPATSASRRQRSTSLSYTPMKSEEINNDGLLQIGRG